MDLLTIHNLQKSFGDRFVLRGLDLSVPEHSIFGFIGANGAGKTTTMKAVLGLIRPDSGEITLAGEPVRYGETTTNRHIGYLPDVPEFYGYLTPMEYLRFCGQISGMETHSLDQRAAELLSLVGLGQESHRIKVFSRGMKQRLGIAAALLSRPRLLICDEPTSALDPAGRKEILDILRLAREETTVFFSTHILSDIQRICTDVAFLHNGKIALSGDFTSMMANLRSDDWQVLTGSAEEAQHLITVLSGIRPDSLNPSAVICSDDSFPALLRYLADHRLSIVRMERIEPDLESIFMEVIGK